MQAHNFHAYAVGRSGAFDIFPVVLAKHKHPIYPEDPTYYLNGGDTVLLVEGVLFKINVSILAPTIGPQHCSGHSCLWLLADDCDKPITGSGTTRFNPIVIPGIKAQQFRHLLLALLGRPGDPEYMDLLTDAKDSLRHTKETFIKYLDIGYLASRLRIRNLADWAKEQLSIIFDSTSRVAENIWGADTLTQLAILAGPATDEFYSKVHIFLRYSLSPWAIPSINSISNFLIDRYVLLYKGSKILSISKQLFGWVFLFVLSLGHQSLIWSEQLTREDRLVLYAAEVDMTSLCDHHYLEVTWLIPSNDAVWYLIMCCDTCREHCEATWDASFGQIGPLNSSVPLEDIRMLLFLPRFRQTFAKAARSTQWPCKAGCGKKVLTSIDKKITTLCLQMSRIYEDLLEHA